MKKFITILFALILMSVSAFAQISYNSPTAKRYDMDAIGYSIVMHHNLVDNGFESAGSYYLTLFSSNQFERETIKLHLGKTKDSAIASLKNILQMMKDTPLKGEFRIRNYDFTCESAGVFREYVPHAAGHYDLTRSGVNAAIAWVNKH